MMMLDIGCGDNRVEGAIALDMRKTTHVGILADARNLPFRDDAFDHVFSSHLIEHFSHRETKSVLREWIRVLRQDGIIEIKCPDLRARALLFFFNPSWQNVRNIYGEQDYVENEHRCGFAFNNLKSLLQECGISNIKRLVRGYRGLPFLPDCLHVIGKKAAGAR
jgi:predicted SAM-dependent methyltransferase